MGFYLDYNAAAPLRPESRQAILETADLVGNASSVHQFGRRLRQKIEQARIEAAGFLQTEAASIIFTSGATEANHLALCGYEGRVVVSAIEHGSVDEARPDRHVCPVDAQGVIDLMALEKLLQRLMAENPQPVMVSVMAANNETGVIQPVDRVAAVAKKFGAYLHCDAVQAAGRMTMAWEGIDLVSVSAHKMGGPQGIGVLANRSSVPLKALLRGGGQERSFRAGTENPLGIAGFAAAIRAAKTEDWSSVKVLRNTLERRLMAECPDAIIVARDAPRLPNTSVIIMKGVKSATQVMGFDLQGIAVSAGSACSSGKVRPSRVLKAMGIPEPLAGCAIRVSLGLDTPPEAADRFIEVWKEMKARAHGS